MRWRSENHSFGVFSQLKEDGALILEMLTFLILGQSDQGSTDPKLCKASHTEYCIFCPKRQKSNYALASNPMTASKLQYPFPNLLR